MKPLAPVREYRSHAVWGVVIHVRRGLSRCRSIGTTNGRLVEAVTWKSFSLGSPGGKPSPDQPLLPLSNAVRHHSQLRIWMGDLWSPNKRGANLFTCRPNGGEPILLSRVQLSQRSMVETQVANLTLGLPGDRHRMGIAQHILTQLLSTLHASALDSCYRISNSALPRS